MKNTERDFSWAITALGKELEEMETIRDTKVSKPGSPYYISLLKLASIIKGAGSYFPSGQVFQSMRQATAQLHVSEVEAMRMWTRALRTANPRYPK